MTLECNSNPVISHIGPCVALNKREPLIVLATFPGGAYLQSASGALYCLCDAKLPIGPFSLQCENWSALEKSVAAPLRRGMMLGNEGDNLCFSCGQLLSYASAQRWQPQRLFPGSAWQIEAALERVRTLTLPENDGLGRLIPTVFGHIPPCVLESAQDAGFLNAGQIALHQLDLWLQDENEASLDIAVEQLIGTSDLGPSGNAMLCGVLFGLHVFGEADFLASLGSIAARAQTNVIGAAYLEAAADGHVSSALHDAVAAICTDADDLEERLMQLAANDRDALLGVLLTFFALQQKFSTVETLRLPTEVPGSLHPSISSIS